MFNALFLNDLLTDNDFAFIAVYITMFNTILIFCADNTCVVYEDLQGEFVAYRHNNAQGIQPDMIETLTDENLEAVKIANFLNHYNIKQE